MRTLDRLLLAIQSRPVGGANSQRKLISLLFKRGEKSRFSNQTKRRFVSIATNGAVDRLNFLNASCLGLVWKALGPFLVEIPGALQALLKGDLSELAKVREVLEVAIKAIVRKESVSAVPPSILSDTIARTYGIRKARNTPPSVGFPPQPTLPHPVSIAAAHPPTAACSTSAEPVAAFTVPSTTPSLAPTVCGTPFVPARPHPFLFSVDTKESSLPEPVPTTRSLPRLTIVRSYSNESERTVSMQPHQAMRCGFIADDGKEPLSRDRPGSSSTVTADTLGVSEAMDDLEDLDEFPIPTGIDGELNLDLDLLSDDIFSPFI